MNPNSPHQRLVFFAALVVVVWGLAQAGSFFVPVCISALLAFLLAPVDRGMRRHHVPAVVSAFLCIVVLLLPVGAMVFGLVQQGESMARDFPELLRRLERSWIQFSHSSMGLKLHILEQFSPQALAEKIGAAVGQGLQFALSALAAVLNTGSQVALILLFTALMLALREHLRKTGERIVNRNQPVLGGAMLDAVTRLIERFLVARLWIALLVGGIDFAILSAFGLKYTLFLSALLGVMTVIPALGFLISIIPTIVVSLGMGHSAASTLALCGALFVMSIVEGNVLTPKLVGGGLNINALFTFLGLFAGGLFWGIWGMLLSVPILGVLRISLSAVPEYQAWGDILASPPKQKPPRKRGPPGRLRAIILKEARRDSGRSHTLPGG